MRPLRWLIGSIVVVFVGLGLTTTAGDGRGNQVQPPAVRSTGSHDVLQVDANMTQQMAIPTANTGSQTHLRDAQLARSKDANYLRLLEQHQADIDRMLARQEP
jgi:hypothetical protein